MLCDHLLYVHACSVDYLAELTVTIKVTAKDRKKREKQLMVTEDEGHVATLGFYVDDFNKVPSAPAPH